MANRIPLWRRILYGVSLAVLATGLAIGSILLLVRVTGATTVSGQVQNTLDRADRNAQLVVAAHSGLRCVLTIRPNEDRPYKETQLLIDGCYKEFDALTVRFSEEEK